MRRKKVSEKTRKYLLERILEKRQSMEHATGMLDSMLQTPRDEDIIEPVELEGSLSCYRGLVELAILEKAYCHNFDDAEVKRMLEGTEDTLAASEQKLVSVLKDLNTEANSR